MIITTRLMIRDLEDSTGEPLAGCEKHVLDSLDLNDAVRFMRLQGVAKGTSAEIGAICRSYGCHPLSLRLLSGLIVRDKRAPRDIATALHHDVHRDLKARQHHVLETAYDALPESLRILLSRLAAFRSAVSYEALEVLSEFASEAEFNLGLDELTARGLVMYDEERNRWDLHPIVRSYAYGRLTDPRGTHTRLRDYFAGVPTPDDAQIHSLDDLAPVIELFHHSVQAGFFAPASRLFESRLRNVLYFRLGAYSECAELCREFLSNSRNELTPESPDVLRLQNRLAVSLHKMGLVRQALDILKQVNQSARVTGRATNLFHRTYINIAQIERDLGELRRAHDDFAVSISAAREAGDNLEVGRALQELALTEIYSGSYEAAASHLKQAHQVQSRAEHNRTATYLALMHLQTGSLQDAQTALAQAQTLAQGYARNQVWVDWLQGRLALAQNRLPDGEKLLGVALASCRRLNLAELEPEVLADYAYLQLTRAQMSSDHSVTQALLHESFGYLEEALAIAERCEYRLRQADIHNPMAQWNLVAGDFAAARSQAQEAAERAWCDGPTNCYQAALARANTLMSRAPSQE